MEFIDEAREQCLGTMANFTRCEIPEGAVTEGPLCNATHESGGRSGTMYWYTEEGVYRLSDHWGEGVGSSNWYLDGGWVGEGMKPEMLVERADGTIESFCPYPESSAPDVAEGEPVCGFCPWDGFKSKNQSMYNRLRRLYDSGVEPPFPSDGRETNQRRLIARLENQDIELLMRDSTSDASLYFRGLDKVLAKAAHAASANGVRIEFSPCEDGRFSDPERLRYRMRIYSDGSLAFSRNLDVKVVPLEITPTKGSVNVDTGGYKMPPPAETLESFCDVLERTVGNRGSSSLIRDACGDAALRSISDMAAVVSSYATLATRVNRTLSLPRRMNRIARASVASMSSDMSDVVLTPPDGFDEESFLSGEARLDPDVSQAIEFSHSEYGSSEDMNDIYAELESRWGVVPLPEDERPSTPRRASPFKQSSYRGSGSRPIHLSADVVCDELSDLVDAGKIGTEAGFLAPVPDSCDEKSGLVQWGKELIASLFSSPSGGVRSNFAGREDLGAGGTAPSPLMIDVSAYVQHRRDKFGNERVVRVSRHLRRNGSLPKQAKRRGRGHRI